MSYKITVNDVEFKNAHDISVKSAMGSAETEMSISTDISLNQFLFVGDIVKFYVDDIQIFAGILETQTETHAEMSYVMSFEGRNIMSVLADSDIKPKTFLSKKMSEIINECIAEIGGTDVIEVVIDDDRAITRFKVEMSQTLLSIMQKLASENGRYVWCGQDGKIYIGFPQGGRTDFLAEFDFDIGVEGDITVRRSIRNIGTKVIVQTSVGGGESPDQGLFPKKRVSRGKDEFLELFGLTGSSGSVGASKRYDEFSDSDFVSLYSSGEYRVIGSTRAAPTGGANFERPKYEELSSDSEITIDGQYRQLLEKYIPEFSIEIKLDRIFPVSINAPYKIKDTALDIDGIFILSSCSISVDSSGSETMSLKFSLQGHL